MPEDQIQPWTEVSRTQIFSKYGRSLDEVIFKMPNGEQKDFVIKNEGPAACIVAITEDNEVVVTRQFRPGLQEILSELPGGYLDENGLEDPVVGIEREFLEETGFKGDMEEVAVAYDDAYSTMRRHCFVAINCKQIQPPNLDDTEYVALDTMPLEQFRDLLRSGKMTDIEAGYLALDHVGLL